MRTIKLYDEETGGWNEVEWSTIVSGSRIQIYEEDGTIITDGTGIHEFTTTSDAYITTYSGEGDVNVIDVEDPSPRPITE